MKTLFAFCFSLVLITFMACSQSPQAAVTDSSSSDNEVVATSANPTIPKSTGYHFPYYINAPNKKQELPQILTEVSALTLDKAGNIYCVQDEQGFIFKINKDGIKHHQFEEEGDYEGIEIIGDDIFVMKSSGTIFQINHLGTAKQSIVKYNDFLNSSYDVEGLGYDKSANALLLACKAGGEKETGTRGIYKFDLKEKKLAKEPYFSISFKDYRQKLEELAPTNESLRKVWNKKGKNANFHPSAIAIHPKSDDIYILSAKSRMLLVCNRKGEILHLEKLKKKIHTQAGGITFAKDGTMYITNEGKDTPAVLYTYSYGK